MTLSTLPFEVRQLIWTQLYNAAHNQDEASKTKSAQNSKNIAHTARSCHLRTIAMAPQHKDLKCLSRTCKMLHKEIIEFRIVRYTFHFNGTNDMYQRLSDLQPSLRNLVTNVKLDLDGEVYWDQAFALLAESTHLRQLWLGIHFGTPKGEDGQPLSRGLDAVRGAEEKSFDFRVRDVNDCSYQCRHRPGNQTRVQKYHHRFALPIQEAKSDDELRKLNFLWAQVTKDLANDYKYAVIAEFGQRMGSIVSKDPLSDKDSGGGVATLR